MNITPVIFSNLNLHKNTDEFYLKDNLVKINNNLLLNNKHIKKDKNLNSSLFLILLLSPILTSFYKNCIILNSKTPLEFLSKRKAKLQTHQG